MKVIIGELIHEGNSFSSGRIHLEDFDPLYGEEALTKGTRLECSSVRGIMDTLSDAGIEVIPTFFGNAHAAPAVEFADYLKIKNTFISMVKKAGKVDGICLGLHGSMYVDGEDDPEGDILEALREIVGSEIPIVAALDMHATVTEKMVKAANAFVGYHTAPHVDVYDTGCRAASILLKVLKDDITLKMEWVRIPMLLAGEQSETDVSPMRELMVSLKEVENEDGIFSASYLLGFPWADSPHNGVSIVVVGRSEKADIISKAAKDLATGFWGKRKEFTFTTEAYPLDEALTKALEYDRNPVIIADSGDNPTAGATQDLTLSLKVMLDRKITNALVVFIVDPVSWKACAGTGVGAKVSLRLGRVEPVLNGAPLKVEATVLSVKKACGIDCAVIDVNGITVIVGNKRRAAYIAPHPVYDPGFLDELGLSPNDYKIILIKSGYLSPQYRKIAARRMLALTPGDTNLILTDIPYKKVPRPIFPLDEDTEWSL